MKNRAEWNINIFKKQGISYRLLKEKITEVSFPVRTIIRSLKEFEILAIEEMDGKKATKDSLRTFFVCRKR